MCQLQHKTLPPHIENNELKSNNSLKQIHYSVKQEDVLHIRTIDSPPIRVDYGVDQFALRCQDKDNTVTYTPLDSFSFQSVFSYLNIYEKLFENKIRTKLQQKLLLKETDLYEDDPVTKGIITSQCSQTTQTYY